MSVAAKKKKIFDGRYEVLSIVGRGACSVVYHARHATTTSNEVALKVLIQGKQQGSNSERLRKEALAMVSSRHRYVIRLDDFHSVDDLCYLAMEYAPLGDLRKFASNGGGKLSSAQALTYMLQAAEALEFVHRIGILHRDIKPDNILVINEKEIRLGDFGVSVLPGEKSSLADLQTGVGTMNYMAPEVLAGTGYDKSSDIYALGVTFYELVSGIHPFEKAPLAEQLLVREDNNLPQLSSLVPDISPKLSNAIAQAMRYDPADRFGSLRDLIDALKPGDKPKERPARERPAQPPAEERAEAAPRQSKPAQQGPRERPIQPRPGAPKTRDAAQQPPRQEQQAPSQSAPAQSAAPQNVAAQRPPRQQQQPAVPGPISQGGATQGGATQGNAARKVDPFPAEPDLIPEPMPVEKTVAVDKKLIEAAVQQSAAKEAAPRREPPQQQPRRQRPPEPAQKDLLNVNDSGPITEKSASRKMEPPPFAKHVAETAAARPVEIEDVVIEEDPIPPIEPPTRKPKREQEEHQRREFEAPPSFRKPPSSSKASSLFTLVAVCAGLYVASQYVPSIFGGGSHDHASPIPAYQGEALEFPKLPAGLYSGTISGLVPGKDLPLSMISFADQHMVAIVIGLPGWTPKVVSLDPEAAKSSIRVASNGFILDFAGTADEKGISGSFKNLLGGEQGEWKLRTPESD